MFWGLKLHNGNQYNSLVEKSFHVSRAVLENGGGANDTTGTRRTVEVHIIHQKVDYIVCLLSDSSPQQSLDLEMSEGEEMTVYLKSNTSGTAADTCVHLTGYHIEEAIDQQWEETGDELAPWDIVSSEGEEDDQEGLTHNVLYGELSSGDDDEDFQYPSLSHLAQPSIRELSSDEQDREIVANKSRKSKRNSSNRGGEASKMPKKRKMKESDVQEEALKASTSDVKEEELQTTTTKKGTRNKTKKKEHSKIHKETSTLESTDPEPASVKQENYKKTLKCGVGIEELKYGIGKIAKPGTQVTIRYSGFNTGEEQLFDSLGQNEKPLVFTIGKGQVMPGLERGLRGMKPGGSRRLTIPPTQRREGDVPSCVPDDSDIVLDVNLISVY